MEIREVTDRVKKTVKKNPLLIVGGIGVVVLLVILSNKKGTRQITEDESEGLVAYNGAYASYPDAVTNAESIVSSMSENLNYAMENLREDFSAQLGAFDDRLEDINNGRLEDREYVKDSLNDMKDLWEQNNRELLDTVNDQISNIYDRETPITGYTPSSYVTNNTTYVTMTDTQKPSAGTSNNDIGALKEALEQNRANKVTGNRDSVLSSLSQGTHVRTSGIELETLKNTFTQNKEQIRNEAVRNSSNHVLSQSSANVTMTGKEAKTQTLQRVSGAGRAASMIGTKWSK